jgi:hypothetical protein
MTMGARRLAQLCSELEESMVLGDGRAIERDLVSEVNSEFVNVRAALAIELQEGFQR